MSSAAASDSAQVWDPPRNPGTFRLTGNVTTSWKHKQAASQPPSGVGTDDMIIQVTDRDA